MEEYEEYKCVLWGSVKTHLRLSELTSNSFLFLPCLCLSGAEQPHASKLL